MHLGGGIFVHVFSDSIVGRICIARGWVRSDPGMVMMAQMFVYTGGSHRHFDSGISVKQRSVYCSISRFLY
jgi:hypothetical protein